MGERHLGRVALAAEHRFAEENTPDQNSVQASDERTLQPTSTLWARPLAWSSQ
jgi:hypothetical protein